MMNAHTKTLLTRFCLAAALLAGTSAWAIDENVKAYRSNRTMGMGGVVVTTGQYGEALFANPATQLEDETWKLTLVDIAMDLNSNIIKDYKSFKNIQGGSGSGVISNISGSGISGHNEHARITTLMPGFYTPHFIDDDTSFALALVFDTQLNLMLRGNAAVDEQAYVGVGPSVGFGHKFLDGALDVGINLHVLYRVASDENVMATSFLGGQKLSISTLGGQGLGLDGDVGAYYKLPFELPFFKGISVGADVDNVARSEYAFSNQKLIKKLTSSPPYNDRTFNTGVRADLPNLLVFSNTLVALEVQDIGTLNHDTSFYKRIHLGAETPLTRILAFRGGINQGYFCGGLGIALPLLSIDAATWGEELGTNAGQIEDRRYGIRLALEI